MEKGVAFTITKGKTARWDTHEGLLSLSPFTSTARNELLQNAQHCTSIVSGWWSKKLFEMALSLCVCACVFLFMHAWVFYCMFLSAFVAQTGSTVIVWSHRGPRIFLNCFLKGVDVFFFNGTLSILKSHINDWNKRILKSATSTFFIYLHFFFLLYLAYHYGEERLLKMENDRLLQ